MRAKTTKYLLILASILTFFTNSAGAQELSREEATQQISVILSSKPYLVTRIVYRETHLHLRYAWAKFANDNPTAFADRVIARLTAATYTKYDILNGDPGLMALHESWQAGFIDRFAVSSKLNYPNEHQDCWDRAGIARMMASTAAGPKDPEDPVYFLCNVDADVVGILKAGVPCSQEQITCSIVVARRQVQAVTGITSMFAQGREIKIVEYNEGLVPTAEGQGLLHLKEEFHSAKALFLLYDDGWRLSQILD